MAISGGVPVQPVEAVRAELTERRFGLSRAFRVTGKLLFEVPAPVLTSGPLQGPLQFAKLLLLWIGRHLDPPLLA